MSCGLYVFIDRTADRGDRMRDRGGTTRGKGAAGPENLDFNHVGQTGKVDETFLRCIMGSGGSSSFGAVTHDTSASSNFSFKKFVTLKSPIFMEVNQKIPCVWTPLWTSWQVLNYLLVILLKY